jgi:hypothetical protein
VVVVFGRTVERYVFLHWLRGREKVKAACEKHAGIVVATDGPSFCLLVITEVGETTMDQVRTISSSATHLSTSFNTRQIVSFRSFFPETPPSQSPKFSGQLIAKMGTTRKVRPHDSAYQRDSRLTKLQTVKKRSESPAETRKKQKEHLKNTSTIQRNSYQRTTRLPRRSARQTGPTDPQSDGQNPCVSLWASR